MAPSQCTKVLGPLPMPMTSDRDWANSIQWSIYGTGMFFWSNITGVGHQSKIFGPITYNYMVWYRLWNNHILQGDQIRWEAIFMESIILTTLGWGVSRQGWKFLWTHYECSYHTMKMHNLFSKQASIFICHSVLTHNNAKMYIKQADRLPERPKAINAGCPKLTDNTM